MGIKGFEWQTTESVLALFGNKLLPACQNYHQYMSDGMGLGRQTGLTGGGLIRSAGGWAGVLQLRKSGSFQKSDERILGDGDFVESVLAEANEQMTRSYACKARGITLNRLQQAVADLIGIVPEELYGSAKRRIVTKA